MSYRISEALKAYAEESIFPLYGRNDAGHRLEHVEYVIRRCFKFAKQFENINPDMLYAIAVFHDVAHHIDKDKHEVLSAQIFEQDEGMRKFFIDSQRKIIKEAIEDHRATLEHEPRSDYGKIVATADRNIDIDNALKRTHAYTIRHYPDFTIDQMLERAYKHISEKFGEAGYAKVWCIDEEFEAMGAEAKKLLGDKVEFRRRYLEVNGLKR